MRARTVAWVVVGITTLCVALDTAFTAAHQPLMSEETWVHHGWPLGTFAALGSTLMGALVISRYPRHPIGWLLLVPATASISVATEAYSVWVLDGDGPGSTFAGHVSGWVSLFLGAHIAILALTLIFLMSPDGHLPSPRWRWAVRLSVAGVLLFTAGVLSIPPGEFVPEFDRDRPIAGWLTFLGIMLVGFGLIASAVSLVLRVRRARGDTRQQLLWIALSAAVLAFGFAWVLVASAIQSSTEATWLSSLPLFLGYLAFPVCTAVAVLRHRLFDIDLIVNRALVLALATALVAAGYVLVVVVVGSVIGEGAGGFWPSLLAFIAVAMGFQPLRRGVVRLADRLAFGARAAPYDALASFSRGLGDAPDAALLLPCVAEAAGRAVSARHATVRLELETGTELSRSWPDGGRTATASPSPRPDHAIPVSDRGGRLGSICVTMPPGRALQPYERQLLADLADQTAIAFRNARMEAELAAHVENLDCRTDELEASRRRLIEAGDAERRRLEWAISRDVVPLLVNLPAALADVRTAGSAGFSSDPLDQLVQDATDALEALRELTRGVFPTLLARAGLGSALSSYVSRTGHAATLVIDPSVSGQRFSARAEGAAYFCITEALPDDGHSVEVTLSVNDSDLVVDVRGGIRTGVDLQAMVDRVEALGGSLALDNAGGNGDGRPPRLLLRIPVEPATEPALQASR